MSNPYDPNAPTSYPGEQPPPPYPPPPSYPQTTPVPPQFPPPPTPGGGYGQGPGGPGYGAPGGYGGPGYGGPPLRKSKAPLVIGAVVLAVVLIGGAIGAFLVLSGDDDEPRQASSSASETDEPTEEEPSSVESPSEEPTSEATVEEPSSPAAPEPPAVDDLTAITGFYTGSYVCSQGPTPLTLTIAPNSTSKGLDAVFSFGGGGSVVPAGSFLMEGTLRNGVLRLNATDWIVQPDGYVSVDLRADVPDASAKKISGKMLDPACDTFTVTR